MAVRKQKSKAPKRATKVAAEKDVTAQVDPKDDPVLSGHSAIGRPTKFSPEVVAALTDALAAGMTQDQACIRADISTVTLQNWKACAEAGDARFLGFLDALTRARADGIRARLTQILAAASEGFDYIETVEVTEDKLNRDDKVVKLTKSTSTKRKTPPDWKAAAWWLERVESAQFGPTTKAEHTGKDGGPISVSVADVEAVRKKRWADIAPGLGRVISTTDAGGKPDDE
jgi:hypothetical protein